MVRDEDITVKGRMTITVKEIRGKGVCPLGHKVGEVFDFPRDRGKLCPHAFHNMYPSINVMRFGGSLPWEDDPKKARISCPDPDNVVVWEIVRTE